MNNPIGVCTWSLHNHPGDLVEVMNSTGLRHLHMDIRAADSLAALVEDNGWSVTSTMVSFPQEDYSTMDRIRLTGGIMPDEHWDVNRGIVLAAIRKTSQLKVPFLSTHAGFIDHADHRGYAVFRSRMLELADAAGESGICLIMETGQETAADLRLCLEDLDHPALGVNFDPANMILYGKGDPVEAVRVLATWIRHVHVKDAKASQVPGEWGTEVPWGTGEVPHRRFLQALGEIGYTGALAIEREAGDQRSDDIAGAARMLNTQSAQYS